MEIARLWKPLYLNGISLFKAAFFKFAYTNHTHSEFAIGVIEEGTQRFRHGGQTHFAPAGTLITVNPNEVHDGVSATDQGYAYRMCYIQPELIQEIIMELCGQDQKALRRFPQPVTKDSQLAWALKKALHRFEDESVAHLEAETQLFQIIAQLFVRHAKPLATADSEPRDLRVVRNALAFIHENATGPMTLDTIAREVGMSRFHFLRLFKATTGLPPHAYLIQRRLEIAKRAIEKGMPLVEVADLSGFSDQSHLTRRFKSAFGVTPGQYQQALGRSFTTGQ